MPSLKLMRAYMDYLDTYTLADLFGLANSEDIYRVITFEECGEILEDRLQRMFPWIDPDFLYRAVEKASFGARDYCRRLVHLGYFLLD
jgi:hypothetical protein